MKLACELLGYEMLAFQSLASLQHSMVHSQPHLMMLQPLLAVMHNVIPKREP